MRKSLTIPPGKAALLLVDLQEEHRHDRRFLVENFSTVIANAVLLLEAARAASLPAYHCAYIVDVAAARPFHPVTPDGLSAFSDRSDPLTAICPEVAPAGAEPTLIKAEASAFGDGVLARELKARGVEWLFVAGVWTEACVDASVKDAQKVGLRVVLVKDACGSGTAAMHRIGVLNLANRLYGGAVADTANACRLIAGQSGEAWVTPGAVPLRYTLADAAEMYERL